MANNNPNLRVRISADINDIKQGLALVRGEVAKFKQEAAQSIDLKGLNDGVNSLRRTFAGLFAGVTVGSVFRAVIQETRDAGDEVAQLRAVLKSTGEQAGYTAGQLTDMADRLAGSTTHSTGEIVKAQTRLLSYTGIVGEQFPKALQMAIDQSARLGESIEQSAETVGKALDKPSQGVAALTKQGFKFTEAEKERMKVLEKSGRIGEAQAIVLDAMAESYEGAALAARNTFGGAMTAVGNSLRDLMDGSGGSGMGAATRALNQLADALRSPEIREGFSRLATAVLNSVTGFAKFMAQDGVKYLRLLAETAAFTVKHVDVLAVAIGTYLAAQAVPTAILGIQGLIKFLRMLQLAMLGSTVAAKGLRAALATMGGPITLAIAALSAALYVLYQRTQQAKEAAEAHADALEQNKEMSKLSREEALKDAKAKREQALRTLEAARAALEERRVRMLDSSSKYSRGGDRGDGQALAAATGLERARAAAAAAEKEYADWTARLVAISMEISDEVLAGTGKAAEDTATEVGKALAKSNALLLDSATRVLAELDRLYADHEISIVAYYSRRVALQQKLIDLQIEQVSSELALSKDAGQRRTLEEQLTKLQRDRAEVGVAGSRDQKKAEEDLAEALGEVRIKLMELDGRTGAAERARLEGQYLELFKRLEAASDETGKAMVRNLIDRLAAKAKLDELKEAGSRIGSALQSTESTISAQASAGLMGGVEAERRLGEARNEALQQYRLLREEALAYFTTLDPASPEAVAAHAHLQSINVDIANIIASQQQLSRDVEEAGASAFGNLFTNIRDGAMSASEMVKQLVADFAKAMFDMQARAAAQKIGAALGKMFNKGDTAGDVGAGAVKLTAASTAAALAGGVILSGASALSLAAKELMAAAAMMVGARAASFGAAHTGGVAGAFTMRRSGINPMVFGMAPRYHNGGIAGLKPDEVPSILLTGERVLSRRQTAEYDAARMTAGGGGSGTYPTPIVAIGDNAVADALASAAGERVILTHVRNNWEGLARGG
ncbi:MAG: phage tail length tape measure family protein [Stenotrophomonas sp.]